MPKFKKHKGWADLYFDRFILTVGTVRHPYLNHPWRPFDYMNDGWYGFGVRVSRRRFVYLAAIPKEVRTYV